MPIYFGNNNISLSGIKNIYFGTKLIYESIPTLDTPINLSVSNATLSFDPVKDAESYEVFANGNSIGEKSI